MTSDNNKPLRVSDLERLTGINRSTIHYYLREGLLSEPLRTSKTMAYYSSNHLEELEEVRRLQEEGYPITFIKKIMDDFRNDRSDSGQTTENPEERKTQILKEAVDVFIKKGYYKAKMSDIAEAVGVGHSTLYLYFPNKETLFMECVDEVLQAMIRDISKDVEDVKNPIVKIFKTGDVVLRSFPHFLEILHVLDNTAGENPSLAEKRKEICNSAAGIIKGELEEAIEEGLLVPIDVTMLSYVLIGITEGVSRLMSFDDHYTADNVLAMTLSSFTTLMTNQTFIQFVIDNADKLKSGADSELQSLLKK